MRELKISPKGDDENNSEYAYRVLRENIMTLRLLPGETLNENAIAEMLSSSRTPVREALFKLRQQNLVEVFPQSASIVSPMDLDLLSQGVIMRCIVESEIVKSLCGNLNEELIRLLRESLRLQREHFFSPGAVFLSTHLDDEFHRLTYHAARKDNVYAFTKMLCGHFDRIRHLVILEGRMNHRSIFAEHEELYARLLTGMDDGLEDFYRRHLVGYEVHMPLLTGKYPDYFRQSPSRRDGLRALFDIARES